MIWVWTDADTSPFAETIPLPISPMLKQWERQYPQSAYQRDLPYGYELLCENVIDMAHECSRHKSIISIQGLKLFLGIVNVLSLCKRSSKVERHHNYSDKLTPIN